MLAWQALEWVLVASAAGAGGMWAACEGVRRLREAAAKRERERLAADLHDTVMPHLTGLSFQIQCARKAFADHPTEGWEHIERAEQLLQWSIAEIRRAVRDLQPEVLKRNSLAKAMAEGIRVLTEGLPTEVHFAVLGSPRYVSPSVEAHLLRAQQEALINALRHARAKHISVELIYELGAVRVRVTDDGLGFDVVTQSSVSAGGCGLKGMRERAKRIGGELTVRPQRRGGTEVVLAAPLPNRADPRRRPA